MSLLPSPLLLPQQTIAKAGAVLGLTQAAAAYGRNGILVHGQSLRRSGLLDAIFADPPFGVSVRGWCHAGDEPTVGAVDALRAELRANRPDWVAAVGGGSVIDLAKAAAGLVDAPEKTAFYQVNPKETPPAGLPLIAAPSTAGTGSEATVVSVLTDPEHTLKQSIRHPSYMPKLVILDPTLLRSCPPAHIAAAGLDAFIQAYESYTSRHATPFTRSLSEVALVRIARTLLPLYQGDSDAAADMLEASYLAGIALSHARLGVIHGLAHPLGVRFHAAHGLVCACCLPACLAFNRDAIRNDLADIKVRHGLDIEEQVGAWLSAMRLENPLSGQTVADRDAFIRETLASGSTAANPRPVTADDVSALLDALLV
ncbi:MAG TPA: iron-containing alcohol dehydrogenase [Kiritimatiellia bacterium]|nr:iron-containing alcohol dehydrogenase [Kiritimatiellia bacterium]HPS06599.1 iron-containing alcohol dehydrogenase [Kiritimatiellia bacterium]